MLLFLNNLIQKYPKLKVLQGRGLLLKIDTFANFALFFHHVIFYFLLGTWEYSGLESVLLCLLWRKVIFCCHFHFWCPLFWGHLHFLGCLHYWGCLYRRLYFWVRVFLINLSKFSYQISQILAKFLAATSSSRSDDVTFSACLLACHLIFFNCVQSAMCIVQCA